MTAPTIRERIHRARDDFFEVDGIVVTTFGFSGAFAEEQVFPVLLGVDAVTAAARRARVHAALGETPLTLFYDPLTKPEISGRYRYVAQPVPLLGRLFHPKLVVIAGHDEGGQSWVYLAVSSANLTLSGWGRNAESFGETWLHTRKQQPVAVLEQLLQWLQHRTIPPDATDSDAVSRVLAVLGRLPDRPRHPRDPEQPWTETLHARLYASVVHTGGLAAFLRDGRVRRPNQLWAYSPYWGDVAANVGAFAAGESYLMPATRADGKGVGMSREQAESLPDGTEVRSNPDDRTRFWHMKAYWLSHGQRANVAVGSCNFTSAGLRGESGNVETMLVYELPRNDAAFDWLPDGEPMDVTEFAEEPLPEEDVDSPAPIAAVVAWDWRAVTMGTSPWRWWIDTAPSVREMVLHLPGLSALPIESGPGTSDAPKDPPPGARFRITCIVNGAATEVPGAIVEINLDHSARTYGRPLTPEEILASWRGRPPAAGEGDEREEDDAGEQEEGEQEDEDLEVESSSGFEAMNLYELYRSLRMLRGQLDDLAAHPTAQRGFLVGRPDSVMALAMQADRDDNVPIVRYLVLHDLLAVATSYTDILDQAVIERLRAMTTQARQRTLGVLRHELTDPTPDPAEMLAWFEAELRRPDREILA